MKDGSSAGAAAADGSSAAATAAQPETVLPEVAERRGAPEGEPPPTAGGASGSMLLGLIADVQYADTDDSFDFSGKHKRHYRNTLNVLDEAVRVWNSRSVSAVVQLGDLIDGCNARRGASAAALGAVLGSLSKSTAPRRFDLIGNHELYNFPRSALPSSGLHYSADSPSGCSYSTAPLGDHWQLVFLDCFEQALIGLPEDHPNFLQAFEVIRTHNEQALHSNDWASSSPPGKARYTPLNGGVSSSQLSWLRSTLAAAKAASRHVLVFSHVPIYEPASQPKTVVWNGDKVLEVLHRFRDSVIAVFAGHDHCGGYAVDTAGLHHVTMCSPLHVAPPSKECFGVLECRAGGWAHLACYGYACAESGMEWQGRRYPELVLAKGAENKPE